MAEWYCFKCKEKMSEEGVPARYLDMEAPVNGLRCPSCEVTYLTEQEVMEVISKGEGELEAKAG